MCQLFGLSTSSYYYRVNHKNIIDPEREQLKQQAVDIHTASRGSAGARTIAGQLTQQGEKVGRYKAASLMREANISSKQPNKHKYKIAEEESKIAPNLLQRKSTTNRLMIMGAIPPMPPIINRVRVFKLFADFLGILFTPVC